MVRRMFADVEADVHVLVEDDSTYDTASGPVMVECLIAEQLERVVGTRLVDTAVQHTYRRRRTAANFIFTRAVRGCSKGSSLTCSRATG